MLALMMTFSTVRFTVTRPTPTSLVIGQVNTSPLFQ